MWTCARVGVVEERSPPSIRVPDSFPIFDSSCSHPILHFFFFFTLFTTKTFAKAFMSQRGGPLKPIKKFPFDFLRHNNPDLRGDAEILSHAYQGNFSSLRWIFIKLLSRQNNRVLRRLVASNILHTQTAAGTKRNMLVVRLSYHKTQPDVLAHDTESEYTMLLYGQDVFNPAQLICS